jgi:hypothetical protein
MLNSKLAPVNTSSFPELPGYFSLWIPIYWEPILASSERVCALIAAKGDDGSSITQIVLREDILKALYPAKFREALDILQWIKSSMEFHLSMCGDFEDWEPPMSGFFKGITRSSNSVDLTQCIETAVPMCASFASSNFISNHNITKPGDVNLDVWKRSIKDAVIVSSPRLKDCFDRKFNVVQGARTTTIDFVGNNLVCNFSRVNNSQLSRCVKDSKAQILDLVASRDFLSSLKSEEQFELVLWRPSKNLTGSQLKTIQEAVLELEGEANKFELKVISYGDPRSAALDICRKEA